METELPSREEHVRARKIVRDRYPLCEVFENIPRPSVAVIFGENLPDHGAMFVRNILNPKGFQIFSDLRVPEIWVAVAKMIESGNLS